MRNYEAECLVPLPEDYEWTESEKWAWEKICTGQVADMSNFNGVYDQKGHNPEEAEDWPKHRNLSATFIELIATQEPWSTAPFRPCITIKCARICETIDLNQQKVTPTLRFSRSFLVNGINLESVKLAEDLLLENLIIGAKTTLLGAKIQGNLQADSSIFDGLFEAGDLEVGGNIFFSEGANFKKGVYLLGAKIQGDLEASGSTFGGLFKAGDLEVGGNIFLNKEANFKKGVYLSGAKIQGNLQADGSIFDGFFEAGDLEVGGNIFFSEGANFKKGVYLSGAKIQGSLQADGSTFGDLFKAGGLEVGGNIFLNKEANFKKGVYLSGAKIQGSLQADGSTFGGLFEAGDLEVGGNIFLSEGANFKKGVYLLGAKIQGSLQAGGSIFGGLFKAGDLEVGRNIFLSEGANFKKGVYLLGAKIQGNFQADGSTFDGPFEAGGMDVEGNVYLNNANFKKEVGLLGAKIKGSLQADSSTFDGSFEAGGPLEVEGNIYLNNANFRKEADLVGTKVKGSLQADRSTFDGPFKAGRLEVGGDILLSDGANFREELDLCNVKVEGSVFLSDSTNFKKEVRLLGIKIQGNLQADRSIFDGPFEADGMEVRGSVFLNGGADFKEKVDLCNAEINGNLLLSGSEFRDKIDLTNAKIAGEINLWQSKKCIIWGNDAALILRNAKAGALQAHKNSWERDNNDRLPVDLSGFNYARLGGYQSHKGDTIETADAKWLINWIKSPKPDDVKHDDHYVPQPYEHLAQVLDKMGALNKAKAVRYAKFEHHRCTTKSRWKKYVGYNFPRLIIGYGVYPFRSLWWFAGWVLVGFFVSCVESTYKCMDIYYFWYSLDNALPLVELLEHDRATRGWMKHFFYLHKILGFVIATVFVGALTFMGNWSRPSSGT